MSAITTTPHALCLLHEIDFARDCNQWAAEAADRDDLLARFALVHDALTALRKVYEVVGAEVMKVAADGDELPGGGMIHFVGGTERKNFDVPLLRSAVARQIAAIADMTDDEAAMVETIVEFAWMVPPCSPSVQFRVGGARKLGVDLDRYCETYRTPRVVRVDDRPNPMEESS